ncbi:PREDICTED: histidine--tRNA ligase [Fragaria vesca subsp. vesca]|uniref:histidine--tRNA ligase n=1 Tax=Fragaria vesca subsp. vesca TaxID=101020 RepID=UPI0002C32404|nr:PREDICTED: histidine--tRNA ligase [Fragaria vesca subsp. vesca]
MAGLPVIRIGGKGSSLSSSAVYAVANALAHVTIDSSALDKLASSSSSAAANLKPHRLLSLPSVEESRASHVVLLAKLLSLSGIRTVLPLRIADALNSNSSQDLETLDLTDEEALALDKLRDSSALYGVISLLDHQSAALSTVSDAVAALSCEALKADVAGFNSVDAGDGLASKEVIGVASDLKVLLNGSKLVGKVEVEAVSEIPKVHASLREQVKSVHAKTREELNSGAKIGKGGSRSASSETTALLALASALFRLGVYSFRRAKLDLEAVGSESVRLRLVELFEKQCRSGESLKSGYKLVQELALEDEENYLKFAHAVNVLMELVWKIVTWEAIAVFVALEGAELTGKGQQSGEANGEVNVKAGKKGEKKKKAVLGKGTTVMVQLIKDKLQGVGGNAADSSEMLENWVKELLSFFNPKSSEFDGLLNKVKEIVESNETRRLPKLPKGTRDFAKEQMTIRKKAFSIIENVFERHGATALDTPVFELRDTLMGKYGEDSKLIYDLADQGGELSSLRYDLTVPFARYVAMNGITSFKRYQIAKVYRRDNPSKGRYREFYQCDFDIAGQSEKMGPDFEAVYVLTELLDELNIGDYEVKLNHRKLLDGMLEICGVPPEKFRTICSSIDKLDKQSFEQIKKEMVEEKGLSCDTADKIGAFVKERGHPLELLSKLKQEGSKFLENSSSIDALNDLEILFKCLEKSQCIGKVVFDLSLARGLDYYTGVIYEAVFKGGAQMGSIAAGGRYDNLIGMFGTKQVPAVGVSLGIERVFAIMEQIHKDQNQTTRATKTEVLVSILGDDIELAAELSGELWRGKIQAEFLANKRVTKHFDRAKDSKIPWMIIVGEKEQNEGVVRLKNIAAGEEIVIQRSDIVEELKKRLNA